MSWLRGKCAGPKKMKPAHIFYSSNSTMQHTTAPLAEKYKFKVYELFVDNWPKKSESDFENSWDGRNDETSVVILSATEGTRGMFLGFVITSYYKRNGDNLYIDYIALTNKCKGNGIGSSILASFVNKAFANRSSIHLWPDKDELVAWYERHGFSNTNDGYYNFHSYETRRQSKIHTRLGLC
jgi:ribosomal protein S18 acetylase RimI-like enzyme